MKTKRKILIGSIAVTMVLGISLLVWAQIPKQFTIAVTGQPGLAFTGDVKVDGTVRSVSGVVPTNFVATARSVDCRFEKQQGGGELGFV